MNTIEAIDVIIASHEKLSVAWVVRTNHLAFPVGVLLGFSRESILFSVDPADDTIDLSVIANDVVIENLARESGLDRFIGCRLKSLTLTSNAQGYDDSVSLEFQTESGKVSPIRFVAGASQLEIILTRNGE